MKKKKEVEFQSQDEIDRDFKIYESGILRLKDLENTLNHLNTRGFWEEEKKIRAKLNSIGEIPSIEIALQALEKKIIKKHGKNNLYKKALKPLKRKKRAYKKREVVIGDVPDPVEAPKESQKKDSSKKANPPLLKGLLPPLKKAQASKSYEEEVKGAIQGENKKPVVIDSVSKKNKDRLAEDLEVEKARLLARQKELDKKEIILKKASEKSHDISLNTENYSYNKPRTRQAISKLLALRGKKSKDRFLREISK